MAAEYISNRAAMMKQFRKNIVNAIARSGIFVQGVMKKELSKPGKGRKHPGQSFRSSAPGDAPTVQTGTLRRSVQVDTSKLKDKKRPRVRVGPGARYARFLAEGTTHILPRPFIRPTIRRALPFIKKNFAMKNLLKGIS